MSETVLFNIITTANHLATLDGPQSSGARWDAHVRGLREAFPDKQALVFTDPLHGDYVAVSPVDGSLWYRALPRKCFGILADLSGAPCFTTYC